MADPRAIASESVAARVSSAFRLYRGTYAPDIIEDATGIEARSHRAHRTGETPPSLPYFLRYAAVLPPAFADHVLRLAGLTGTRPVEADAEAQPHQALAALTHRVHLMAEALADGRIDHQERATLIPALRALSSELQTFTQALEMGR